MAMARVNEVPSLHDHENGKPNAIANGNGMAYADVYALPWPECPVIDFSLLFSPSLALAEAELQKLRHALISWNCFQLVNHGMTSAFLDQVREVSQEYFGLPQEEKMKLSRKSNESEGFVHDVALSHTNVPQILNDYLFYTIYPQLQRKLHLWPQNPPALRNILEEFGMKVEEVNRKLWEEMLKSIGVKNSKEDESMEITTRVNFSPACPFPELPYASPTHTDESVVTYSLQDAKLDGLHVRKNGNWFKLPVMPHAIFVKFGDQIETLSNGEFKGTVHRVVTRSEKDRISLALYCALPSIPIKEEA